jgi:predicted lactoylglutathione lyase
MSTKIFVNLPVQDLDRAVAFFTALGFRFNPQFTDRNATCMIVTPKPISDARKSTEVLMCLSADSRADVDAMVAKAVAAGGSTPNKPQDHGFMYQHGFEDLDGHLWEVAYMDMAAMPANP